MGGNKAQGEVILVFPSILACLRSVRDHWQQCTLTRTQMPSRGESSCNRAAALAPHLPASMKVPHTQFVTLSRAWTSAVLGRLPHGLCGMRVSLQIQVALKQPHRDTPRQAAPSGCSPVHSELLSSSTGYGSLDPDLLHFTPHLSSVIWSRTSPGTKATQQHPEAD